MKILIVGANGTIGRFVANLFQSEGHEIYKASKTSGDYQVNIESQESIASLYKKIGKFDAVVNAAGDVIFAPLQELSQDAWALSLRSKLMGQVHLVQEAIPYISEKGSFTLISGVLSETPIFSGVAASTVNRALEAFVMASACELPKGLRINVISPTVLLESIEKFGAFFPGFSPVPGEKVAEAYKRSVFGIQTGQVFRVF